ncbi:protein of unknown function [Nitrosotalea devaniterrae]|uniref:Uncharacterized protein n=1 Tax=Nitrosotalea devaniterrae TaxID=1078905 RepID=A0A128A1U5_9ARCH|nr:protein of unknown function [Candidatus Nitrosotalea devanaterra]
MEKNVQHMSDILNISDKYGGKPWKVIASNFG